MIEIDDMRTFVEAASSGGFTRAAERLRLAKSVVSRRIARMEGALGVQLLRRTTRGITLTEAGAEFKARCERILAEFEEATDAIAAHRSEIVGRLRLAAPNSIASLLAPTLAALGQQHPRLEIDASFSDRLVDLVAERFDVAIRVGPLADSTMVARRIAPVRSVVVASPDYVARHGRPQVPQDLVHHSCLIYASQSAVSWRFRVGNRWTQIPVSGRFRSDSGETLVAWAEAGLGIVEGPDILLSEKLAEGRLVRLLEDFPTAEYGMYAIRPSGAHPPARVRVLVDALMERFGACRETF